MVFALRLIMVFLGLLFVWIGFGFVSSPMEAGPDFGITGMETNGLSALRADFTAFFWVAGGAFLWAAWRNIAGVLLVPAALFAIAFFGRTISLFADGFYEGWWMPMAVEALSFVVSILGYSFLPKHRNRGFQPAPLD